MPTDGLPRVLFVGRGRYWLPLTDAQARKWDAVAQVIDYRVLGAAEPGSSRSTERFRLSMPTRPALLSGAIFQARLPLRIARQIREFEPDAIICADPFLCAAALVARGLVRRATPVIVEVHGDRRTFMRSYGSRRGESSHPAEPSRAAALRRADATRRCRVHLAPDRGCSWESATTAFQRTATSPHSPIPVVPVPDDQPRLFVGTLEPYKNVDGLAAAWHRVAPRGSGRAAR